MQYKASILTSIYNGKDFIESFLKDIKRQTIFEECQFIMIDANSSDYLDSEKHIGPFVKEHDNVQYHKIVHEDDFVPNVYTVWNIIIRSYAESELLTNWNLDDVRHPRHLELHVKALRENPSVSLAYASVLETNEPNETFESNTASSLLNFPEYKIEHLFHVNMPHNCPVWRRSIHEEHGYFDEQYFSAGDYDMWLRAACEGSVFMKINGEEPLGLYYRNPEGISSKESTLDEAIKEVVSVKEKHYSRYLRNKIGHVGMEGKLW